MRELELLAPAKNFEYGKSAIDFGADAVYIAAARFGARYAAGNSMEEIAELVRYAHAYRAKVFLTLNTLLFDSELDDARRTAEEAWQAGVDALIIQDMAIAGMDLPPIELHASTQTLNLDPEKAAFFENAGFSRVILERAIDLNGVRAIRERTGVELEAFVHGAICVCYSGGCYLSQAVTGRSGNRGVCSQPCRLPYNLYDSNGKLMMRDKHLLSVGDLNLSERIADLVEAGITSFKIEGRLKDIVYLKNSVAHYRAAIDRVIEAGNGLYTRASDGLGRPDFTADPGRSFTRGFTEYYIDGPKRGVASFDTPKSIGEYIGKVTSAGKSDFVVKNGDKLAPGDGICFLSDNSSLSGTNINKVEGNRITPNRMDGIKPGTEIYRNYDHRFSQEAERSRCRRKIDAHIRAIFTPLGLMLDITDCTGESFSMDFAGDWQEAKRPEMAMENIVKQLSKSGDAIFSVTNVEVKGIAPFISSAELNAMRRELLDGLYDKRIGNYVRRLRLPESDNAVYPVEKLDYKGNILNKLAEKFYRKHGVAEIEKGVELTEDYDGKELMRTRYCIRRELGKCGKEPLFIENNGRMLELNFDCKSCEMTVKISTKRPR